MSIIHDALKKKEKKTPKPSIISGAETPRNEARLSAHPKGILFFFVIFSGVLFIALVGAATYIAVKWGTSGGSNDVMVILPSESASSAPDASANNADLGAASLYSRMSPDYRPAVSPPYFDLVIDESLLREIAPNGVSEPPPAPVSPAPAVSADQARQQRLLEEAQAAYINLEFALYTSKLEDCLAIGAATLEGRRAKALLEEYEEEEAVMTTFEQATAAYDGEASISRASSASLGANVATGDVLTSQSKVTLNFSNAYVEMEENGRMKISRLDRFSNAGGSGEIVSLMVEAGTVTGFLRPQPQGSSFTIASRRFSATAFSGIFTLSVSPDGGEKISVRSGEVSVRLSDGTRRTLKRGEELSFRNGSYQR